MSRDADLQTAWNSINSVDRKYLRDFSSLAVRRPTQVMEFFPRLWSFDESRAVLEKIEAGFAERGFGVYTLEHNEEFAGIVGLSVPTFEASFTPCVEILWRLLPRFWGRGLVSEAGVAVLKMAFQTLRMSEVVAFAAAGNVRSIRVMERLGMEWDRQKYFDHPAVTDIHLRRHVLYRAPPKLSSTGDAEVIPR